MSSNQTIPPRKNADTRVPPVSNEYVEYPFSLWRFLSYPAAFVLLLLTIGGVFWGTTSFTNGRLHPTPTHTPATIITPIATIPPTPATCLDQPPLPADQKPALFFCSPKLLGNVAGPFGTHIVLVGENFPSLPTRWLLHVNPFKNNTAPDHCTTTMQNDCLILPAPDSQKQVAANLFWMSWTWQKPFPATLNNYFISAQINKQVFTTDLSFTLLSSQSPCITISTAVSGQAQPPACTVTHAPLSLSQNAPISLQGRNWLLGWNNLQVPVPTNMTIHILAVCAIHSKCNQPLLFNITIDSKTLLADGSFSLSVTINAKGTYRVSAWDEIPTVVTPGGGDNTVANNALSFGENNDDLVLKIV